MRVKTKHKNCFPAVTCFCDKIRLEKIIGQTTHFILWAVQQL